MVITCDENGIVKWKEEILPRKTGEYFKESIFSKKPDKKNWYKVGNEYLHIVPDEDGIYVNGLKINLLPKESTMKTRFAVVNEREKVKFEKEWQMPYGYNNSPKICFNQDEAIQWIRENLGPTERKEYVVERHKAGKIEIVWKILDGHKLAGEEEQEEHDFDEDF